MEIIQVEGLLAQEVVDIIDKSLLLLFLLAIIHGLHEAALGGHPEVETRLV